MIGTIILHYRILEKIGAGGMGVVYKAEDTRLKRLVALKFLPGELTGDPQARARFIQEAQAAAALDHPNICTIYGIDEAEGRTFIVMAYIKGQSLKEKIRSGPLGAPEAVKIALQVAEGLKQAHAAGIVHRDIKPGNIMLTGESLAKILDFGLAKLGRGAGLTRTMAIMGTAAYMSPEQARGDAVDHRTDIWSLGCMLFEMLSGELPFQSENEQAVIYSIIKTEPRRITRTGKRIPASLERVIYKCLEKDPANRYQDAAALAEALRFLEEPSPQTRAPSIAVLPFMDMSPQKDQEYFCDGLAEELINALTHVRNLRVVARTSAFSFKGKDVDVRDIGRTLSVETVLEGSIRKAGNKLRITAQLIKVEDGFHLWSEKFDREMEDIFSIQDEIAKAIVDNLELKLLAQEKAAIEKRSTEDAETYNLYLKGLYFTYKPTREDADKALDFFKKAIDRDPNFAPAHMGMAMVFTMLGNVGLAPPAEVFPKAKAAFRKALEMDDRLAEAHLFTGYIAFWYDWDWEAAENSYKKALAINPGNAFAHATYSFVCFAGGRFDDAVREIKLALSLDPLMPLFYTFAVIVHYSVGKYDEALSEFHKAVEMDPHSGLAYFHAGMAYYLKGEFEGAIAAFQKSKALAYYAGWADGRIGIIHAQRGEKREAEKILQDMRARKNETYVSATNIGWLYGALGDYDEAFASFDKAYAERDSLMPFIHLYTQFAVPSLAEDPRFKALLKKMKLAEI